MTTQQAPNPSIPRIGPIDFLDFDRDKDPCEAPGCKKMATRCFTFLTGAQTTGVVRISSMMVVISVCDDHEPTAP